MHVRQRVAFTKARSHPCKGLTSEIVLGVVSGVGAHSSTSKPAASSNSASSANRPDKPALHKIICSNHMPIWARRSARKETTHEQKRSEAKRCDKAHRHRPGGATLGVATASSTSLAHFLLNSSSAPRPAHARPICIDAFYMRYGALISHMQQCNTNSLARSHSSSNRPSASPSGAWRGELAMAMASTCGSSSVAMSNRTFQAQKKLQ